MTRVINWSYYNTGAGGQPPGHHSQRAMRLVNAAYHPNAFGCAVSIGAQTCDDPANIAPATTPNEIDRLEVYVAKIAEFAFGLNLTTEQRDKAVRFTIGHETGHGTHVCHKPDDTCDNQPLGTMPSLMDNGFFAPEEWESRAEFNSDVVIQMRRHVDF